jgi:hypothetical protein
LLPLIPILPPDWGVCGVCRTAASPEFRLRFPRDAARNEFRRGLADAVAPVALAVKREQFAHELWHDKYDVDPGMRAQLTLRLGAVLWRSSASMSSTSPRQPQCPGSASSPRSPERAAAWMPGRSAAGDLLPRQCGQHLYRPEEGLPAGRAGLTNHTVLVGLDGSLRRRADLTAGCGDREQPAAAVGIQRGGVRTRRRCPA